MSVIKKLHHPIYFLFSLMLGIAIGYKTYEWWHLGNSEPTILLTAIVIMIISMLRDRQFETTAVRTLEDIKTISDDKWTHLTTWITDHLSPAILSLDSREKVLRQATDLINTASREATESNRYIVYVGSGDLLKDPPNEESEKDNPAMAYQSSIQSAKNDQITMVRYISLLDDEDFKRRIHQTQTDYLRWLDKQITNLEGNRNYTFWDCPRAPKWGSSRSSIFTERALLDVIGNGQTGVLIRGDQISNALLKGSTELFRKQPGVEPAQYNPDRLKAHRDKLEKIVSGLASGPPSPVDNE